MSGLDLRHVGFGLVDSGRASARSGLLAFRLAYDRAELDAALAAVAGIPRAANKAIRRALNRAASGLRTDVAQHIRKVAPLRAKDVRAGLTVRKAAERGGVWDAAVHVAGSGVPLIRYGVRPLRQTAQRGRTPQRYTPLTYLLERGGRRHDNRDESGEHRLFVAPVHGELNVYYRPGPERGHIVKVFGPTLQFHVAPEPVRMEILRKGDLRFRKELAHQIAHLAGGGR